MWFGSPLKPDKQKYMLGDDGGCFAHALWSVRTFGGVIEHPEASRAYDFFGLTPPPRNGGWVQADTWGGFTCCVEQGHYGHAARKTTWLYGKDVELQELMWGSSGQRLDPTAMKDRGYEIARRRGIAGAIGGKFKQDKRARTPGAFRDLLVSLARSTLFSAAA